MSDDCLFCRIVQGEIPSDRVLETDDLVAFRDIDPKAPTHVLVIPREHIASLSATREDHRGLLGSIQLAAAEVARREGVESDGWRIVSNIGDQGGQSVGHLHYHVLGGRQLGWPPG
ncbi:MAG TPA: histidine triad nucleotide-binding protein [Longimicrobiales bacterium]|nr:histidine triad nucleotide-binding protein [Longimicrobiales bacterium]